MKAKIVFWSALIVLIISVGTYTIVTEVYARRYTTELQNLLNKDVKDYKYVNNVSVEDMMKRERHILLEMSPNFNSLSIKEKYNYLKNDLGEKLQHTYSCWVNDNKIYNNKLWETGDLTASDIALVINCESQTYKYGYYKHEAESFYFVDRFIDSDGLEFVNDEEKDKNYDNSSDSIGIIGNGINEDNYNNLTYNTVTDDDTLGEVWAMAQLFVEDKLKSPSSADFPVYGDSNVSITNSGDYYKVTGYVDAENSFGAEIRSTFSLVLKKGGSKYTLKECNIY